MQNVVFDSDAVPIILHTTKGVDSIPIILDPKVGCEGNNDSCTHIYIHLVRSLVWHTQVQWYTPKLKLMQY